MSLPHHVSGTTRSVRLALATLYVDTDAYPPRVTVDRLDTIAGQVEANRRNPLIFLQARLESGLREGRTRFTGEQIIAVSEAEAGAKAGDLARRHGVSGERPQSALGSETPAAFAVNCIGNGLLRYALWPPQSRPLLGGLVRARTRGEDQTVIAL